MSSPSDQPRGAAARVRRLVSIEERLPEDGAAVTGWLQRLCRSAVRELPASGVGVSIVDAEGLLVTVAASSATSGRVEELQFTMGEGPCLTAYATRRPVLVPDLAQAVSRRWPGYAAAAHDLGVRSVFAFPLQLGVTRLGAIDVYRHEVGGLSDHEVQQVTTYAEVAMSELLDPRMRAEVGSVDPHPGESSGFPFEVYQAQGMVMIQLGVSAETALVRLRGHAFAAELPISEVARHVIDRRLCLAEMDP